MGVDVLDILGILDYDKTYVASTLACQTGGIQIHRFFGDVCARGMSFFNNVSDLMKWVLRVICNCRSRGRCQVDTNSFVSEQFTAPRRASYCSVMFAVLYAFPVAILNCLKLVFTGEKLS